MSDVQLVDAKELQPHPRNPRRGEVDVIRDSIRENGFFGAVVAQRSTGYILAGNHRYQAALAEGIDRIPTMYVDVDDDRALKILLADNRTSDVATYDETELLDLLAGVDDLLGTGWDDAAIAELMGDQPKGGNTDPDEVPDPPKEPVTKPGDLWALGDHRLLCGDATSEADVARVFDGEKPLLMVTDPPYGVDYDPKWRADAAEKGLLAWAPTRTGDVTNDDRADWSQAYALFPGDVAYVWHAATKMLVAATALLSENFLIRSHIIWAKQHFPISRGHYHWRHAKRIKG